MQERSNKEVEVADPRGLFRDGFAMENLSDSECRTIFLEWAMTLRDDVDMVHSLGVLHAHYQSEYSEHYLFKLITEGLQGPRRLSASRRRRRRHPD